MVEGRIRNFYAESVLSEQPFVRDETRKTSVRQYADQNDMKLVSFEHWELES
jgi:translation elongation factor EF-Ts